MNIKKFVLIMFFLVILAQLLGCAPQASTYTPPAQSSNGVGGGCGVSAQNDYLDNNPVQSPPGA